MILGLEIAMLVIGFLALVRGRLAISSKKVVVGVPARLLGLLSLAPLPIVFAVGILYVIVNAPADPERFADDNKTTLIVIEAGIVIGIAVLVFGIGAAVAVTPQEAARRQRGNRYDDEYDDKYDDRYERDDRDDPPARRAWER